MSDPQAHSDAPTTIPGDDAAREATTDPALTSELIEQQIDQAIDAAQAVADAVEDEAKANEPDDAHAELDGDFEAPDQATIDEAAIAVTALNSNVTSPATVEAEPQPQEASAPPTESTPEPAANQLIPESEPATPVESSVTPAPESKPEPAMIEDDQSIEQIDTMLAEMAETDFEHDLDGDFHTVDQVVTGNDTTDSESAHDIGGMFETVEQVTGIAATLDPTAPTISTPITNTSASLTPAPATAEISTDDLEGSFDSLEDLFGGEIPETPSIATDEDGIDPSPTQPDANAIPSTATAPRITTPAEVPAGSKAEADPSKREPRGSHIRALLVYHARQLERRALASCAKVNHPMRFLHPEMRDTIGWVALAVAGPGVVFFALGLIL